MPIIKLFQCFWSKVAYGPSDICELHDESQFRDLKGYSEEDIAFINNLDVGQSYVNHDHGLNSHIVTRVR